MTLQRSLLLPLSGSKLSTFLLDILDCEDGCSRLSKMSVNMYQLAIALYPRRLESSVLLKVWNLTTYKDIVFYLDSRTYYFFWFTSCWWISSLILFIAAVTCPGSSPCSVFSSTCFFLLVVITLLLAQWLNSPGIKYQTFTLLMWTTLLSRIGRWWYWQHCFCCVVLREHECPISAWLVSDLL